MNCREFENCKAEYLAGELSADAFEAAGGHVESCAECRAEIAGLQAAAAVFEAGRLGESEARELAGTSGTMRSGAEPMMPIAGLAAHERGDLHVEARLGDPPGTTRTPVRRISIRRGAPALLRYAAVVALAFGAGYWMRGPGVSRSAASPIATGKNPDSALSDPLTDDRPVNPAFVKGYRRATEEYPSASSFSKSLLALARR